ncbi:MAG: 4Fe-4S binding protein [Clostridiales Family XIII bacterium]|jgi:adenylylsulfate reductase subunit B|nr:4Fe-4S binding protein [Clostridiales Family XIII bacterium]
MSILFESTRCISCKKCAAVCPGSLITVDETARIEHPERCWGCASCVKECPVQAIGLYLGEDVGGKGGRMTARQESTLLHWQIAKSDGTSETITVDLKDSNKY